MQHGALNLLTTSTFSVLTAIGAFVFVSIPSTTSSPLPCSRNAPDAVHIPIRRSIGAVARSPEPNNLHSIEGIGLLVFAGGKAGFGTLIGPTGGYLFGFIAASFAVGKACDLHAQPTASCIGGSFVVGTAIIYALGVLQLSQWMNGDILQALVVGVFPFLVGDAIKVAVATTVATRLRRVLPQVSVRHAHLR